MPDLTPEFTDIRDFTVPQRDGSLTTQKRVTFYLGKFGPFTEYFPSDGFTMGVVQERVSVLRQQLEGLHQ
jgi:hypothetical protein